MRDSRGDEPIQPVAKSRRGLAWHAVHEIHGDVPESRAPRERERFEGPGYGVDAAQGPEYRGLERLHAEAETVHASLEQDPELLHIQPFRIRLDRELPHAREVPRTPD